MGSITDLLLSIPSRGKEFSLIEGKNIGNDGSRSKDRMKPYYEENGIVIYNADCREILPSLPKTNLVLTDPPYAIGCDYGQYKDDDKNLQAIISDVFPLMLSAATVVALTPGIANVHKWPQPRWILAWVQLNAQNSTGYWGFNEWQPILVYGTCPFLSRGMGRRPDVIKTIASPDAESQWLRNNHPCVKPYPSWLKILSRLSPEHTDVVVDPMMGSGTTLAAARRLGRKAIGIELEESYCALAVNRLRQEVLQFV